MARASTVPIPLQRMAIGFAATTAALAALTVVLASLLGTQHILDVAMIYLLFTLLPAAVWGYAVGLYAAVLADLLVNFYFVPPVHTFTVQEPGNVVALVIFLAVAIVGSSMLALLRRHAARATAREQEANQLLDFSRELAHAADPESALTGLCEVAVRAFHAAGCALLHDRDGWSIRGAARDIVSRTPPTARESAAAAEALRRDAIIVVGGERPLGAGSAPITFIPLPMQAGERAVVRLTGPIQTPPLVDRDRLLLAFAGEASVAVHQAELAAEAARAEALQRADEFKTVLLSSISHDLRSPLTAIKTAVGNLRDVDVQWQPHDVAAFLETIETQTDRLTAVVSDLLQISRLESGTVATMIEPIQVSLLLRDAAGAVISLAPDREVRIEAAETLWVAADYGLLMQALANLIENAARYSAPGSAVVLSAEPCDRAICLSVADGGPAIAANDLPHMFEKFYRGTQATRTRGTGLGLSIAKAMVELCGGTIDVRSSAAGNTFTITLPAAEARS